MHSENNSYGSYWYRAGRCQSGHQHNDRRSRDPGTFFRCDEQNFQQTKLLPQRKFKTDRLSKKERGGCTGLVRKSIAPAFMALTDIGTSP